MDAPNDTLPALLCEFEGHQLVQVHRNGRRALLLPQIEQVMGYAPGALGNAMRGDWSPELRAPDDFEVIRGAELRHLKSLLEPAMESMVGSRSSAVTLVYESGLHRIAILSNKPIGVRLRDFLCREVMPQIARTGTYLPSNALAHVDQIAERLAAAFAHAQAPFVAQLQRLTAETQWLREKMDRLERGTSQGVIGASVAERQILAPLRRYASTMASIGPKERHAALLRSWQKRGHDAARSAVRFHGIGRGWANLPTEYLTDAVARIAELERSAAKAVEQANDTGSGPQGVIPFPKPAAS